MSVMLISNEAFEKLNNATVRINKFMYNSYNTFEISQFAKNLYKLNIEAWNNRYKDDYIDIATNISPDWENSKLIFTNDCELLKTLQAIYYNIDATKDQQDILNRLELIISRCMIRIIYNLEEYQEASWG